MGRHVVLPPVAALRPDGTSEAGWWHEDEEHGRIVCDLCPRECHLKPGDRGFCFVRQNIDQRMVLSTYGRSTGFCIDPIEKKPLNHFYPGTSVLSFGTAGCNLGCKFCQNWDISKSREVERLSELAMPEAIVEAARYHDCRSVAFTYNDPIVWAEYAIDTARACRAAGIGTVAVTAGYISPAARAPFFEFMDAANVDLKGFTEDFYYKVTYSHLQPVLDTIEWLRCETPVWVELTNLVIPQTNDAPDELRRMCDWIVDHCGRDTPVHFSAFHPDFRLRDLPPTPHATLLEAYDIARAAGLDFVYVGNVDDVVHQSTYCPQCGKLLIERNWYALGEYHLQGDRCGHCQAPIAGRFAARPGNWGRRRQVVPMARFTAPPLVSSISVAPSASSGVSTMTSATPSPAPPPPAASPGIASAPLLTPTQQQAIRSAANAIVVSQITGQPIPLSDSDWGGVAGATVMGAFVTLKRAGRLRACCGVLGAPQRLADAVRQAAVRTATEDTRLPPISPTELPQLTLDVNLLYGFQPLPASGPERLAAVVVGRHGLQIRRGQQAGLFLPSVPVEQDWDVATYLRQVCRKAGLPTTAWEDGSSELTTFESCEFGGPIDDRVLPAAAFRPQHRFSDADFRQLEAHARTTVEALLAGATPQYYVFGVADGTVAGVGLVWELPGRSAPVCVAHFSLRPGVPLQATLFQLCEAAARAWRAAGVTSRTASSVQLHLVLLDDPAMQGTLESPELDGLDPRRRCLLVLEQGRSALVYAPELPVESQPARLASLLRVLDPSTAGLFSLDVQTSAPQIEFSTAPAPVTSDKVRPPAVAGMFYPAEATELGRLVDDLLAASPRQAESWPVAMVPHAGLVYSGRLAAAVLNRLQFPSTVVILGPKHTSLGVEWAIAPHETWSFPGGTLAADVDLARRLAANIPGWQLDAAAHRREHAIEVELPLLARLAPQTRVVGIAIGGGNWQRCQEFATGLARVLGEIQPRPLLLISSDMNHFATDRENRRLDEIALQAFERLDPAHLLQVVREQQISMCGVLPAVIALETLRQWGGLRETQRVGYATSAEVSGDTSRVVGYAGMLVR
ncbi:MAG: AmmeMemoRadiSam system radical SAM enzyme [Pirellulales bacterium]